MVQTFAMYHSIGAFIVLLFASVLAFATADPAEDLVFIDIAGRISCDVEYGRRYSRVEVGDFVTFETRSLHFFDNQGEVINVQTGQCGFEQNVYVCRWGATQSLSIDISNTSISEVTAKPRRFVHGYAKLDIFRPRVGITCPIPSTEEN